MVIDRFALYMVFSKVQEILMVSVMKPSSAALSFPEGHPVRCNMCSEWHSLVSLLCRYLVSLSGPVTLQCPYLVSLSSVTLKCHCQCHSLVSFSSVIL